METCCHQSSYMRNVGKQEGTVSFGYCSHPFKVNGSWICRFTNCYELGLFRLCKFLNLIVINIAGIRVYSIIDHIVEHSTTVFGVTVREVSTIL